MEFKVGDYVMALYSSTLAHEAAYVAGRVYIVTGLQPKYNRITTRNLDGKERENGWGANNFINLGDLSNLEKVIYGIEV